MDTLGTIKLTRFDAFNSSIYDERCIKLTSDRFPCLFLIKESDSFALTISDFKADAIMIEDYNRKMVSLYPNGLKVKSADEIIYAVGDYRIDIYQQGKCYHYYYQVIPNKMHLSDIYHMMNLVEERFHQYGLLCGNDELYYRLSSKNQNLLMWLNALELIFHQSDLEVSKQSSLNDYFDTVKKVYEEALTLDNGFIEEIKKHVQIARKRKNSAQSSYEVKEKSSYVSSNIKRRSKEKVKWLENELMEQQTLMKYYKNLQDELITTFERVQYLFKQTGYLNDSQLISLQQLKDEYDEKVNNDYILQRRICSSIFELFIFTFIIEALQQLGFKFETNEMLHSLYYFAYPCMISLTKDNLTCEIYYDYYYEKVEDLSESGYCRLNSMHNRPDFLLSFKLDGKIVHTMIIEVKWRNLRNFYQASGESDVMLALKDYYQLCYFDCDSKTLHRQCIDEVIVVFPDNKERFVPLGDYNINALGVLCNKNVYHSKAMDVLKQEMQKYI